MMTKAMLCGLAGLMVFSLLWVRRLTGPWRFNAAVGVNVYRHGLLLDPLFWTLALTAMFACASLYLAVVPRHSL